MNATLVKFLKKTDFCKIFKEYINSKVPFIFMVDYNIENFAIEKN
ncbi:MAG: hypothetical protein JG767_2009 [Deferribacteraceae bacterium]|jgi:hypothetical protein|nr:hypothetical protein [Deferribacteraceae bacterium]